MPQPKSSSKSNGAKRTRGRGAATASRSKSASKSRAHGATTRKSGARGAAVPQGVAASDAVASLRELLNPVNLLLFTRDRLQDALDDAVRRGRVTREDAEDLVAELVRRGRRQTEDMLAELDRAVTGPSDARRQTHKRAAEAGRRARDSVRRAVPADRMLREVDRARRAAGLGSSFPITAYDDLAAAQVIDRLDDLSPPELRKVRDHERRNANRKTVLTAIERKLA